MVGVVKGNIGYTDLCDGSVPYLVTKARKCLGYSVDVLATLVTGCARQVSLVTHTEVTCDEELAIVGAERGKMGYTGLCDGSAPYFVTSWR